MSENKYKGWAIMIGFGLALFPIHNVWLTKLATYDGVTYVFIPALGTIAWLVATLFLLLIIWKDVEWGDRKVWIPLLIVVIGIGISGVSQDNWTDRLAPLLMGCCLFCLYLVSRKLGREVFIPLAIGAGIASLGIIVFRIMHHTGLSGGFVFENNYDVATGYILLGTALFIDKRWQWLLGCLALIALMLSGSTEAVWAVGILAIIILIRRDVGWKIGVLAFPLLLFIITVIAVPRIYTLTAWAITGDVEYMPSRNPDRGTVLERRWESIEEAMTNIKPFGEGYILTDFSRVAMVHNVPLVIVQQSGWFGIAAGAAWLWVSIWCLLKTRWKYVWVSILALSVFDHFIWTQLAPWWWVVVGASTASNIKNDWIFKDEITQAS